MPGGGAPPFDRPPPPGGGFNLQPFLSHPPKKKSLEGMGNTHPITKTKLDHNWKKNPEEKKKYFPVHLRIPFIPMPPTSKVSPCQEKNEQGRHAHTLTRSHLPVPIPAHTCPYPYPLARTHARTRPYPPVPARTRPPGAQMQTETFTSSTSPTRWRAPHVSIQESHRGVFTISETSRRGKVS